MTSDSRRQVRRIVDGLLRNQRTATKPRRALQKQMIDPLVSTARKDSAQKTQTAITGIFRPASKKTKQSRQHVSVRSFQKKMVDRPVVKDNRKEPKSNSRRRSRNRPKQKETLCRNQRWKPSVFLPEWNLKRKKELRKKNKIYWPDYDVKVVYLEEANLTRHVIQRGDTHQIPLASPE